MQRSEKYAKAVCFVARHLPGALVRKAWAAQRQMES